MKKFCEKSTKAIVLIITAISSIMWINFHAKAAEPKWPRDIQAREGKIVIYQPQLESFKGDKLTARAAVSVTPKGKATPVFGAVWFSARVSTDRNTRMVRCLGVEVANAKFPHADPAKLKKLAVRFEKRREIVTSPSSSKIGRNMPCPCGSGKKFKNCCLKFVRLK